MIFISFGRKRLFERKKFRPSFSRKPNYAVVFKKFAGGTNAKTIIKKIREAEKGLNLLDKRVKNPSSTEYKTELKRLYTQKYSNIIRYWIRFWEFARASKAEIEVIKGIENKHERVKRDWASVQEFLE